MENYRQTILNDLKRKREAKKRYLQNLQKNITKISQQERDKNLAEVLDVEKTGIARGYYPQNTRALEEIKEDDGENDTESVDISLSDATVSQGSVSFESSKNQEK